MGLQEIPYIILLERNDGRNSWGFQIRGGETPIDPHYVAKILPGSLAARAGLRENDEILQVGQTNLFGLSFHEAQKLMLTAGNKLELFVHRMENANEDKKTKKVLVHNPYNSPMGLYSEDNINDAYSKHAQLIGDITPTSPELTSYPRPPAQHSPQPNYRTSNFPPVQPNSFGPGVPSSSPVGDSKFYHHPQSPIQTYTSVHQQPQQLQQPQINGHSHISKVVVSSYSPQPISPTPPIAQTVRIAPAAPKEKVSYIPIKVPTGEDTYSVLGVANCVPSRSVWPPPNNTMKKLTSPLASPQNVRKVLQSAWPPKTSACKEYPKSGFLQTNQSEGKQCIWPPPKLETQHWGTPIPISHGARNAWNPSPSPPPNRGFSPSRRRDLHWPPKSTNVITRGSASPQSPGSHRRRLGGEFDDYITEHASCGVPATYRPPPFLLEQRS